MRWVMLLLQLVTAIPNIARWDDMQLSQQTDVTPSPCPDLDTPDAPSLPDTYCPNKDPPQMRSPVAHVDYDDDTTLEVTWQALPLVYNVSTYKLQMSRDGAAMETVYDGLDISWRTTHFSKNVKTQFWIKAINCASGSPWSDKLSLDAVPVVDAPRRPEVVSTSINAVSLKWKPCIDQPASDILLEMRMAASDVSGERSNAYDDWVDLFHGPIIEYTIRELSTYQWYWFRIAYTGGPNSRTWSPILAVRTNASEPNPPRSVSHFWVDKARRSAHVAWLIDFDGGVPVRNYTVEMASDLDDDFSVVYIGSVSNTIVPTVPGRSYTIRIVAENDIGKSGYSRVHFLVCPPTVPDPPKIPELVSKTASAIKILWEAPEFDGGEVIKGFEVDRGDGEELPFQQMLSAMTFEHESSGLFAHTVYRFRVRAVNSVGAGNFSKSVVVRTKTTGKECPGGTPADSACFGHGSCDLPSQTCTMCTTEWTLDDCSGRLCPNNCTDESHGICDYSSGICLCNFPWRGLACSVKDMSSICPSCKHGFCNAETGKCQCDSGFAGDDCSEYDCQKLNQCSGHGKCVTPGVCLCSKGWYEVDCSIPSCVGVANCSYHGQCVGYDACMCESGYVGKDCSESLCPGDCNGHGTCLGMNKCLCNSKYSGVACENPICVNNCSTNGVCIAPNECECYVGWSGFDCSFPLCDKVNDCSGNGNCTGGNNCTCDFGFAVPDCKKFACEKDCNGNGDCVAPYKCLCDAGWAGPSCTIADCTEVANCSGNGNCSQPNVCSCADGWGGVQCRDAKCDKRRFCSGRGKCISPQNCYCDEGFGGESCELRTLPTNALSFNEASDSVSFMRPLLNDLSEFTVEGWFNISSVGSSVNIVSQRDFVELFATHRYAASVPAPLDELGNRLNPLVLQAVIKTKNGAFEIKRQLSSKLGVFHYIALTVDLTTAKLFVDGGLLGQVTLNPTRTDVIGKSEFPVILGGGIIDPLASETPKMSVSSLRIWRKARKVGEIQTSMSAGSTGIDISNSAQAFMIGSWKFGEMYGKNITDSTTTKLVGNFIGEPQFILVKLPSITSPSPPLMLEHAVTGSATIRVMWEPPSSDGRASIFEYILEKSDESGTLFSQIYRGGDMEVQVTGLEPKILYKFRVKAVNFAGESDYSTLTPMSTVAGVPLAPKKPPALEQSTQESITVSWTRPRCNGKLLTSYVVEIMERRMMVRIIASEIPASSPRIATIGVLLPGKEYEVRVRGVNDVGFGVWSESAKFKTAAKPPSSPLWSEVSTSARGVTLGWSDAPDNGATITRFVVQRALQGPRLVSLSGKLPSPPLFNSSLATWESASVLPAGTFTWTDDFLVPSTQYYYRIRAENSIGSSQWTEIKAVTETAEPTIPSGVTASEINQTSARISWRPVSTNGPVLEGYRLEIAPAGFNPLVWESKFDGLPTSTVLSNLEGGHTYMVRLLALNCKGWSGVSAPFNFTTLPFVPNTPTSLNYFKRETTSISLIWVSSASVGGLNVSYVVEMKSTSLTWSEVFSGPTNTATISSLRPGRVYEFRVAAQNQIGISKYSDALAVKTNPAPPSTPTAFVVVNSQPTSMGLEWALPEDNGSPIIAVELRFADGGNSVERLGYSGLSSKASINGLKSGVLYRFRLRAISAVGASQFAVVEASTQLTVPSVPRPPRVITKTADSLTLGWIPQKNTQVDSWRLEALPLSTMPNYASVMAAEASDGFEVVCSGNVLSCEIPSLMNDRAYAFRLQAINSFGSSPYSSVVTFSVLNAQSIPDSPLSIDVISAADTSLTLSWTLQATQPSKGLTFVVEQTVAFPHDSILDGSEQGWLQPKLEKDPRASFLGPGVTTLTLTEVYRGPESKVAIKGLEKGKAYGLRVRSINNFGESAPSPLSVYYSAFSAPTAPLVPNLVNMTSTSIAVDWILPFDGGSPITDIQILVDTNRVTPRVGNNVLIVSGLSPGSSHAFVIIAKSTVGETAGPSRIFQLPYDVPNAPAAPAVKAVDEKSGQYSLEVTWSPSSGGLPATGYTLLLKDPCTKIYQPIVANKLVTIARLSRVMPTESYEFRLITHSVEGVSKESDATVVVVPSGVPLKSVAPRIQSRTSSSIIFGWDDTTAGENSYELQVASSGGSFATIYSGGSTSYVLDKLAPGSSYQLRLRSVNAKGAGEWSDAIKAETSSLCIGPDGSVCSSRGECSDGLCRCYKRYAGSRCQYLLEPAVCGVWAFGNHLTFDNSTFVTAATGEHLLYSQSRVSLEVTREDGVKVSGFYVVMDVTKANSTGLTTVNITSKTQTLTITTGKENRVSIYLDCNDDLSGQIVKAPSGLKISDSPFHVRFDSSGRFAVSVKGSPIRILIHPFAFKKIAFLNIFIVDWKPRLGQLHGLCGEFYSADPSAPRRESWLESLPTPDPFRASSTWTDRWAMPTTPSAHCGATTPLSAVVVPRPSGDVSVADKIILSMLEMETGLTIPLLGCSDQLQTLATKLCGELTSSEQLVSCSRHVCQYGANDALVSYVAASQTLTAIRAAVAQKVKDDITEETKAVIDGSLFRKSDVRICPL